MNEVSENTPQLNKNFQILRILTIPIMMGLFIWLLSPQPARAQLDVVHYIPPMFGCSTGTHTLYLSTPDASAVAYTVEDGTGTTLFSGSVSNAVPVTHAINSNVIACNMAELNAVSTKGLIITAGAPIYANVRHSVASQAGSLTAKGYAALGTRFRAGVMRFDTNTSGSLQSIFIAVMATEDNTTVNLNEFKSGIVFNGTATSGSPATTDPISVNLDANEAYVIAIRANSYAGTAPYNDLNGTLITSDKPIAVNTGTWLGGPQATSSGSQDMLSFPLIGR
jgi:hypothetical protein